MGIPKCATCGGDLSRYLSDDLYYCNSCGKLYMVERSFEDVVDDLVEELSVTGAARKLRLQGKTDAAVELLEDQIAKEGADPKCLRELLLIDLNAFSISEYLLMNRFDKDQRQKLRQNDRYRLLLDSADTKIRALTSDIEAYLDGCDQLEEQQALNEEAMNVQLSGRRKRMIHPKRVPEFGTQFIVSFAFGLVLFPMLAIAFARSLVSAGVVLIICFAPSYLVAVYGLICDSRRYSEEEAEMALLNEEKAARDKARSVYKTALAAAETAKGRLAESAARIELSEKEIFEVYK